MLSVEIEQIDPDSPVPLYIQAEQIVRRLIRNPLYADGSLLPNELELSEAIGVSRSTMREAMNKLVFEGLLIRKKGLGTRVAAKSAHTLASNWYKDPSEFDASDLEPDVVEVVVSWERTPRPVAKFYQIPEKRSVIKVERIYSAINGARVHVTSWLNPRVGLRSHMDFENTPVYELLRQSGIEVARAKEEISARVPEPWVYKKLNIRPGSTAIFRRRFVFDTNDKPVEYRLEIYDASQYTIEYDLTRPAPESGQPE